MRLIDADALKKAINDNGCRHSFYFDIFDVIDDAPTITPCKDCDLYFKAMTKEEMKKGGAE